MYHTEASLALLVHGVLASPFLPHVCFRSSPRTALANHVLRQIEDERMTNLLLDRWYANMNPAKKPRTPPSFMVVLSLTRVGSASSMMYRTLEIARNRCRVTDPKRRANLGKLQLSQPRRHNLRV